MKVHGTLLILVKEQGDRGPWGHHTTYCLAELLTWAVTAILNISLFLISSTKENLENTWNRTRLQDTNISPVEKMLLKGKMSHTPTNLQWNLMLERGGRPLELGQIIEVAGEAWGRISIHTVLLPSSHSRCIRQFSCLWNHAVKA